MNIVSCSEQREIHVLPKLSACHELGNGLGAPLLLPQCNLPLQIAVSAIGLAPTGRRVMAMDSASKTVSILAYGNF